MKTGGGQINKTGGGAQSKSGEAPMVKIKDFTLASQNRGGGGKFDPPCPTHRAPMAIDLDIPASTYNAPILNVEINLIQMTDNYEHAFDGIIMELFC